MIPEHLKKITLEEIMKEVYPIKEFEVELQDECKLPGWLIKLSHRGDSSKP